MQSRMIGDCQTGGPEGNLPDYLVLLTRHELLVVDLLVTVDLTIDIGKIIITTTKLEIMKLGSNESDAAPLVATIRERHI